MDDILRNSGIDAVGDIPWGTHFCQFFQDSEELLEILSPFFKAGLENNELCVWIPPEGLSLQEGRIKLKKTILDLERYLDQGRIEVLTVQEWCFKDGCLNKQKILDRCLDKLHSAHSSGLGGLRIAGYNFSVSDSTFGDLTDYELAFGKTISQCHILALCQYTLGKYTATG